MKGYKKLSQRYKERNEMSKEAMKVIYDTMKSDDRPWTIDALLREAGRPFNDVIAREALWKLIDRDLVELTLDYTLVLTKHKARSEDELLPDLGD